MNNVAYYGLASGILLFGAFITWTFYDMGYTNGMVDICRNTGLNATFSSDIDDFKCVPEREILDARKTARISPELDFNNKEVVFYG